MKIFRVSFFLVAFLFINQISVFAADNPNPPSKPVRLVFIHHSTGDNWLNDGLGNDGLGNDGLGNELGKNRYYVSDTYYGWGPNSIGDTTDIGHWWDWYRGPNSNTYMQEVYSTTNQNASYTRPMPNPGGENEIIMFKSCFPNSALGGGRNDTPTTGSNPLRGQDCYSQYHTVANAKGIYNDVLEYFEKRQDKLFIVITAPPLSDGTYAANARAFNNWLMNDWLKGYQLKGYQYKNVFVFDFYNVLTATDNHHYWMNSIVQHVINSSSNTLAYPTDPGDDHPSTEGNRKATSEFVPLLNVAYNRWKDTNPPPVDTIPPVISGVTAGGITTTGAVITWTTDESADSVVRYGTTASYGSSASNTTLKTSHSITLTGLTADTAYHYQVVSKDASNNTAISGDYTFTTLKPANNPPVADFTASPVSVVVNNNVQFTSTSTGSITGYSWNFGDGSTSTSQNPVHAYSKDGSYTVSLTVTGSGGSNTKTKANYITVKLSLPPVDTTPPVITNVSVSNIAYNSVVINWITDEFSDSIVEYGTTTSYGSMQNNTSAVTNHSITLSDLTQLTKYYYRVKSKDSAGNEAVSQGYNFTTLQEQKPGQTETKTWGENSNNDYKNVTKDSVVLSYIDNDETNRIWVRNDPLQYGLLYFDLSAIAGKTATNATLRVKIYYDWSIGTSPYIDLHNVEDSENKGMWNESAVTTDYRDDNKKIPWVTNGSILNSISTNPIAKINIRGKNAMNYEVSVDVTGIVKDWSSGAKKNQGFFMKASAGTNVQIYSKETACMTNNPSQDFYPEAPFLEVSYSSGIPQQNQAPVLGTIGNKTVTIGNLLEFTISATDADGDNLTYSADRLPQGATFIGQKFSWAPTSNQAGGHDVTFTVNDGLLTDSETITITVNNINQAPVLGSIGNKTVSEGSTLTFTVSATDPDGDTLTYSADRLPQGATLSEKTFTWTPGTGTANSYPVTFTVSDGSLSDSETITITVNSVSNSGAAPSLTEILAASEYLNDGDIPTDNFKPPTNALYVATNGNDNNSGISITQPFLTIDKAIDYANKNPNTAYTIYIRGGTYKYKAIDTIQEISRGNLYITSYQGEKVIITSPNYPSNPTDWYNERAFVCAGSYENITFNDLSFEGWSIVFNIGLDYNTPATPPATPLKNIVIKNMSADSFRYRNGDSGYLRAFLETSYLGKDEYGPGKVIFSDPSTAHYQIENLILDNININGIDIGINIGDENDANIKGFRLTRVNISNPTSGGGGTSAADALAIVNSYKVLIDHCKIENIEDDGIDTKSYDVCVINTFVRTTGRNAVKFWKNGELINSIIYDCTPIDDGAIIIEDGPFRMVNSILMKKNAGYAGTFNYGGISTAKCEIINCIFSNLIGPFYVGTSNLQIKNSIFYDMPGGIFSGQVSADNINQLNNLANCSGNLSVNPQLGEDFSAGLNCRDTGITQGVLLPSFDLLGRPRISGRAPDIGPIEFLYEPPINNPPVLTPIGNKSVNEGQALTFTVSATDPDNDTLTYSANNLPAGAVFSGQTFSWTPTYIQAGNYNNVTFTVSDGALTDSETITISVGNVNRSPFANAGIDQTVNGGDTVTLDGSGSSDPDGDTLTYSWTQTGVPAVTLSSTSVVTPTFTAPSVTSNTTLTFNLTVTDTKSASSSDTVNVTVKDVPAQNNPPVLAPIGNKTVNEGQTLTFTVSATDPDGDSLTYSATNLPAGATFSGQTFSWMPSNTQSGTYYNVRFNVSDGFLTDYELITITVYDTNDSYPSENLALKAKVTASSLYRDKLEYDPLKANDNEVGMWDSGEWASDGEMTPWIRFKWNSQQLVNRFVLYDRSNPIDHIMDAWLYLNINGRREKSVHLGMFPYGGAAKEIVIDDTYIDEAVLVVTRGVGLNVGLSEFKAYYDTNVDDIDNLAAQCKVTASSFYRNKLEYAPIEANNNRFGVWDKDEWASDGEMTPWIRFKWDSQQLVNRFVLYDRSNPIDHIMDAWLYLNRNGERIRSIHLGMFPYGGAAKEIVIDDTYIDEAVLVVTRGVGLNVGLSEFKAYYDTNVDDIYNLAVQCEVTASSTYKNLPAYEHAMANNNRFGLWDRDEWASDGEMTPWIRFKWDSQQLVNRFVLYDRSNPIDHIMDAWLYLNRNGERMRSIHLGMFPYGGAAKEVVIDDTYIDEAVLVVTQGVGLNVGLSEFKVYEK